MINDLGTAVAFAELWRGLYAALPNADYEWPVSLPATLQAAGLAAVEARGDVGLVRGATPEAEILRLSVEAMRERMPDDIDIEAGLKVLDDPTSWSPASSGTPPGVSGSSAGRADIAYASEQAADADRPGSDEPAPRGDPIQSGQAITGPTLRSVLAR